MVAPFFKAVNQGSILQLIALREIRDDCLCLRATIKPKHQREYMAVVRVEPINLPLMSDGEQEAILEGFRAFIAGLSSKEKPLSIHCRTIKYDLQPYLDKLDTISETQTSDLYRAMAADHKAFVQKLASQRALLQRDFFVRVPIQINVREGRYRRLRSAEVFDQAQADLARRTQDVIIGLARAGLVARRLNSEELVHYYLSCVHTRNTEQFALPRSVLYTVDYPMQTALLHVHQPKMRVDSDSFAPGTPDDQFTVIPTEQTMPPKKGRCWIWKSSKNIAQEKQRQSKKYHRASGVAGTPDLISLPELIQPASVEQTANYIKIHHNVGDEYLRARAVIGYPAVSLGGWFDQLLSIDEPCIDFILFIETVDSVGYVRSLTRAISGYRATQLLEQRHGRTEDPYIAAARNEVEDLRDKLVQKTEQVHAFSLSISAHALNRGRR